MRHSFSVWVHGARPAKDNSLGCLVLIERAAEYQRLSELARSRVIAEQLTVFAEANLALGEKLRRLASQEAGGKRVRNERRSRLAT